MFLDFLSDWIDVFKPISKPNIKYIFPKAPLREITRDGNIKQAWFNVRNFKKFLVETRLIICYLIQDL
jgi:hypothetical protein